MSIIHSQFVHVNAAPIIGGVSVAKINKPIPLIETQRTGIDVIRFLFHISNRKLC